MATPKKIIAGISVLAALVAVFATLFRNHTPLHEMRTAATLSSPVFHWRTGTTQSYHFNMQLESRNAKQSAGESSRILIEGNLNLKIFSAGQEVSAGFQLLPVSVSDGFESDPSMASFYSRPFLVTINTDGRFTEFHYPPSVHPEDKSTLSGLVLPFEAIILPSQTYAVTQQDTTGTYQAVYRLTDQDFHKQKKFYEQLETEGDAAVMDLQAEIVSSVCIFSPAADQSWLEKIQGEDVVLFAASKEMDVMQTRHHYALQLDPDGTPKKAFQEWEGLSFNQIRNRLQQEPPSRVSLAEQRQAETFNKQYNQTELRLEQMVRHIGERHNRQAVQAFRRFLALFPEETFRIPDLITHGALTDRQHAQILNSLGVVGTPEAQEVLLALIEDPDRSDITRFRAAISFSSIAAPLAKAVQEDLFSRVDRLKAPEDTEINGTLVMSIGTIARNIQDDFPEESREMVMELKNCLPAKTETQTRYLIKALGNSGDERVIPEISNYLSDDAPRLREAAARALSHMPPDQIDASLQDSLASETDTAVLTAIVQTLSEAPISRESNAVIGTRALRRETGHDARRAMIAVLSKNMDRFPQNRQVLSEMLPKETSRENAKQIIKALSKHRPDP